MKGSFPTWQLTITNVWEWEWMGYMDREDMHAKTLFYISFDREYTNGLVQAVLRKSCFKLWIPYFQKHGVGIVWWMCPANARESYNVTSSHWLGAFTKWSLMVSLWPGLDQDLHIVILKPAECQKAKLLWYDSSIFWTLRIESAIVMKWYLTSLLWRQTRA